MMRRIAAGAAVGVFASAAAAEIMTVNFAQVGQAYSAAILGSDPRVGQQVVSARVYLNVRANPGANAADFFTDQSLPIEPLSGNTNAIVLMGSDLGWSGSGDFSYFLETTMFNGTIVAGRYGGETPPFDGTVLPGSRIELDIVPAPGTFVGASIAVLWAMRRRR